MRKTLEKEIPAVGSDRDNNISFHVYLISDNPYPRQWRRVLVPFKKIKCSPALLTSRIFREAR